MRTSLKIAAFCVLGSGFPLGVALAQNTIPGLKCYDQGQGTGHAIGTNCANFCWCPGPLVCGVPNGGFVGGPIVATVHSCYQTTGGVMGPNGCEPGTSGLIDLTQPCDSVTRNDQTCQYECSTNEN